MLCACLPNDMCQIRKSFFTSRFFLKSLETELLCLFIVKNKHTAVFGHALNIFFLIDVNPNIYFMNFYTEKCQRMFLDFG